jgi:probable F420-dependent oxidoreductase
MLVGFFHFPTDYGIDVGELAHEIEARGFDSLFVCEHTHIPVSRRTPFPGGGELPKRYSHTYDPFVALAFAAAATRTLLLGTGIALVPQRDPIITAKSVASLDRLSAGRFVFGIGGGWNVDEMENHGTRYKSRFKILRERVLAMQALWTHDTAEFHGDTFDPVWLYPKPKQKPYPPILLGGESDHTLRRVVEFGTAGSRVGTAASSPIALLIVCAKPQRRAGVIRRPSQSRYSMHRRARPYSRPTAKQEFTACCSKRLIWVATMSCACLIATRRLRTVLHRSTASARAPRHAIIAKSPERPSPDAIS